VVSWLREVEREQTKKWAVEAKAEKELKQATEYSLLGRVVRVVSDGLLIRRDIDNLLGESSWEIDEHAKHSRIKTTYIPNRSTFLARRETLFS
jgi:hypothetical protein